MSRSVVNFSRLAAEAASPLPEKVEQDTINRLLAEVHLSR